MPAVQSRSKSTRGQGAPKLATGANGMVDRQIVWALALKGDINEPHKGGNASRTFAARLKELGATIDAKTVSNRMIACTHKGWIERVMKDRKCYAIRLKIHPAIVGANPYKERKLSGHFFKSGQPGVLANRTTDLVLSENGNGNGKTNGNGKHAVVLDATATPSIRERLVLVTELVESIQADLDRLDAVRIDVRI
jgi:hypothetical protein